MNAFNTFDIERDGTAYRIEYHFDSDADLPWEGCDGHGIVSEWTLRDKRPGERVLCSDRQSKRYYDVQATSEKAKREGWGIAPELDKGLTQKQITALAVENDFQYLRGFCNDQWHYMGIVVFPLTEDGDELRSKQQSLWGIESTSDDEYLASVQNDLIDEITHPA